MLDVDEKCAAQIETISKHPAFADETIRIMSDGHSGKGCVVGFTLFALIISFISILILVR